MPQDPNRLFDKTSLKIFKYEGVHRDYIAHAFRWAFISTRLVKRTSRILDIGCGVDTPLVKVLSAMLALVPKSYLGVDMNKIPKKLPYKWIKFIENFNFAEKWRELSPQHFDLITCLEVVEHMNPAAVNKMLKGALNLLADGGRLVISTPVFNGRAAKNHINEMTVPQLHNVLDRAGFEVVDRFGTFASQPDIARVATEAELAIVKKLKRYYTGEVVACFLAPLYPDNARNNIWICKKREDNGDLL